MAEKNDNQMDSKVLIALIITNLTSGKLVIVCATLVAGIAAYNDATGFWALLEKIYFSATFIKCSVAINIMLACLIPYGWKNWNRTITRKHERVKELEKRDLGARHPEISGKEE